MRASLRWASGVWTSGGNGSQAEACDGRGHGVGDDLEASEDFSRRGGLIAEAEDEQAGLDLFGGEQVEAAGVLAELELGGSGGAKRAVGQRIAERGIAGLVEGREPGVEQMAGGAVGDEADLVAIAGQDG